MSGEADTTSTRNKVLAAIRTAPAPPTVEELATSLDLHHNSVRQHAATLKEAGLITQDSRPGRGRGRPQITYRTSASGAWTGRRDYQLLASLLLSELGVGAPAADAARRMGRAWGRKLADDGNVAVRLPTSSTRDRVVNVLDELGFEPAVSADDSPADSASAIELRNCPFRDLVEPGDSPVCALHAGMLDGLAEVDADPNSTGRRTSIELHPFTSPQACTVRMRTG